MKDSLPTESSPDHDFDAETVLDFLAAYHALEAALVRAGFTRAGCNPGTLQPDWGGFIRHIEGQFDPESSPVLMGAVSYLLADPQMEELRTQRSIPASDILWLSEVVRGIRDRLLLQLNFPGMAWGDETDVAAASFIIRAWSKIDPQVESLLRLGHV
jgi:hypothetical protein